MKKFILVSIWLFIFGNIAFPQSGNWDYVGGKKNNSYYIDTESIEYTNGGYKVRQKLVDHKNKEIQISEAIYFCNLNVY